MYVHIFQTFIKIDANLGPTGGEASTNEPWPYIYIYVIHLIIEF